VDIADEFLDGEKLIVYTKGDKQEKQEYRCKRPGLFEQGKLMLLVDEGSASASEVVAGALQDWDRATIIGRRTFGKGLVQEQYTLTGGAALRLTVARYYTPAGRSIQKSYANGRDLYNEEVMERFHNGELIHPDTLKAIQGEVYKTKGGRRVYGGGGITPDIFVPYDTSGFSTDLSAVFYNQHFGKFIYSYYVENKRYFSQFKDPADFNRRYQPGPGTLNSLKDYLEKNSVSMPALPAKDKTELERRIKAWMARQIWRMPGYYEVNNSYDKTVEKALEEINR
jgi:carboxyl-terminal processing protease